MTEQELSMILYALVKTFGEAEGERIFRRLIVVLFG